MENGKTTFAKFSYFEMTVPENCDTPFAEKCFPNLTTGPATRPGSQRAPEGSAERSLIFGTRNAFFLGNPKIEHQNLVEPLNGLTRPILAFPSSGNRLSANFAVVHSLRFRGKPISTPFFEILKTKCAIREIFERPFSEF